MSLLAVVIGVDSAMGQITLSPSGSVAIKTAMVNDQYGLSVECSTGTTCGNNSNRVGMFSLAGGSQTSTGVYGRGAGGSFEGIGIRGHAEGNYVNTGIWGSASGPVTYGGYFTQGIYVSGGISQPSDERLKTNIRSLRDENITSVIRQLNPIRYEYLTEDQLRTRNLPPSHAAEGQQLGLIAQELEQLFPELVGDVVHVLNRHPDLRPEDGEPRTATLKAINYQGLIITLIAAIQEQQEQIDAMRAALAANGIIVD